MNPRPGRRRGTMRLPSHRSGSRLARDLPACPGVIIRLSAGGLEVPVPRTGINAELPFAVLAVDTGLGLDGADAGDGASRGLQRGLRGCGPVCTHREAEFIVIPARERERPGLLLRMETQ